MCRDKMHWLRVMVALCDELRVGLRVCEIRCYCKSERGRGRMCRCLPVPGKSFLWLWEGGLFAVVCSTN